MSWSNEERTEYFNRIPNSWTLVAAEVRVWTLTQLWREGVVNFPFNWGRSSFLFRDVQSGVAGGRFWVFVLSMVHTIFLFLEDVHLGRCWGAKSSSSHHKNPLLFNCDCSLRIFSLHSVDIWILEVLFLLLVVGAWGRRLLKESLGQQGDQTSQY